MKRTKFTRKNFAFLHSIRVRIIALILAGFFVAAVSVVILANEQVKQIIDQSQQAVFEEKIRVILNDINQQSQRLELTGQKEAYENAFQISLINELRQRYYTLTNAKAYPFILDMNGTAIMHPSFEKGDSFQTSQDFVQKMISIKNGDFDYQMNGENKWCIIRSSQEWEWIIGYTIPLNVKYQDVYALRHRLILVVSVIFLLVSLMLFIFVSSSLSPITKLTSASKSMAEGDLDHEIKIGSQNELGILAHSFDTMRNSIKKQILVLNKEISERKQAQKEQESLQGQLSQAQKLESVGRLAGGVAHDFNNMLAIIIGETDLIMNKVEPTVPFYSDLEEILNAALRSAKLTEQLLAYARKQPIAPKIIDLNHTLEGMLQMLRRLLGENIELSWLPKDNLGSVLIDPSQLDQILANLCVNARDAMGKTGKITIETGAAQFDQDYCAENADFNPGNYVFLGVSDNGKGMDKETLVQIFEPFFTTKGLGLGTGLGLSTTYGIIQQNNGFIHVHSEPGRGTSFEIYLPIHKGMILDSKYVNKSNLTARGDETIFVVEDDPTILQITSTMLEGLGYTVLKSSQPKEAIKMIGAYQGEIDLLLTDVVMPKMNGRDLANVLLNSFPKTKILFMSGYTANVIAPHGVLEEGLEFIQKPFSKTKLSERVREILDKV